MLKNVKLHGVLAVAAMLAAGCSQSDEPTGQAETASRPDATYVLADEPEGAQGVAAARQAVQDGDEVTVVGHIGGSEKPFVDGIAAFTIVDPQLHWCADDEGCPTPWDYCCSMDKLKDNTAMVKVVGADGKPVMQDAKNLLGVKELSKVIVRGTAQRDEEGNLTVLAEKVHVAKR